MRVRKSPTSIAALLIVASASAADPGRETNPPPAEIPPETLSAERASIGAASGPNLIINGDFENTSATVCRLNLYNAAFNTLVPNVSAFGAGEYPPEIAGELDLMVGETGCGFIVPWSGKVTVGMSSVGTGLLSDALAFELASAVSAKGTYRVSFHASARVDQYSPDTGPIEIGLSNDPDAFGSLVFQGTPQAGDWQEFAHLFVAPVNATYLTVRQANTGDIWNFVDGFSLTVEAPVPAGHVSWGRIKTRFR